MNDDRPSFPPRRPSIKSPPGESYQEMLDKHGRPHGAFEMTPEERAIALIEDMNLPDVLGRADLIAAEQAIRAAENDALERAAQWLYPPLGFVLRPEISRKQAAADIRALKHPVTE